MAKLVICGLTVFETIADASALDVDELLVVLKGEQRFTYAEIDRLKANGEAVVLNGFRAWIGDDASGIDDAG